MTPLGQFLEKVLRDRDLQQKQLADLVHVNPSYISTLISGKKGPPSIRFIESLELALKMSKEEVVSLRRAVQQSNRDIKIPVDASCDEYIFVNDLQEKLGSLSRERISAMRSALSADDKFA